jgi:hypothetical protein
VSLEREAAAEKERARMELEQKLAADLKRTSTLERNAQEAEALLQAIKTPPEPERPKRRSKGIFSPRKLLLASSYEQQ